MKMLIIYYVILNGLAFIIYGMDKQKAKHRQYRISEFTLLTMAFLGGGIGAYLGMIFFHHKTNKFKFKFFVPLFILMHIGGLLWILY